MKYSIILMALMTILFTPLTQASGRVPFGHQVIEVQNYSRATEQIAISGMISDGGTQALAATGFKTVIDLRTKNEGTAEEKALVDNHGCRNHAGTGGRIYQNHRIRPKTGTDSLRIG